MPASGEGGTPGGKIKVKFVFQGEGALFPQLQGRTYTAKSLLTKSINALDTAAVAFSQALTKKRKACVFLDKVETVYQRKQQLEEAFEKLIAHTYELEKKILTPPPHQETWPTTWRGT